MLLLLSISDARFVGGIHHHAACISDALAWC